VVPYHEVADQWWGKRVLVSYRDQWIDDAIAQLSPPCLRDTKKKP